MNKNKLSSAIRYVMVAPFLIPGIAFAQSTTGIEEVIVTGSNIKRSPLEATSAVTSIDAEELKISGNNLLADTLFSLPSAGVPGVSQTTSNFSVFASGLSTVDLRNLGTTRTLVLVNGRRYVGGDSENPNVVDLNSIPAAFIEKIDIVTGGASAVYGSEAMAGVVNIITKQNFEGIQIDLQSGKTSEGDGEDTSISLTGGRGFDDGRGHAMFHLGYSKLKEIFSRDRDFSKNDENRGDFQSFSSFPPQGGIFVNDVAADQDTDPDNNNRTVYTTIASDGTWTKPFVAAEDGFNRAAFRLLRIPLSRKDISFDINYDVTENTRFFIESSFTQTDSFSSLEPTITGQFISVGDVALTLPSDNPFIPDEVLETWTIAGEDIPSNLTFRKRFSELGPRFSEQKRDTIRTAFGLEGEVNNLDWEIYYQWGQTSRAQSSTGNFNTFFFQQALNAEADPDNPGSFRCKNALARSLGCAPIDVFGLGSISPDAINFVAVGAQDKSTIEQQVIAGKISGELFDLTSAGALAFAAGIESRKESLDSVVDALAQSGLSSSNASAPVSGSYDVNEAFLEFELPLLEGVTAAESWNINLAYRFADYSTLGNLGSWKLGTQWAPISSLRFRASISESVRAPNVAELFDPGGETFESFVDPCLNGGQAGAGNTATNCASLGIPANYDPGSAGGSAGGIQAGNPNLKEETADTQTIGLVFTPNSLSGFSITLDYFNIQIDDAIELIDPQVKLNECYASEDFPNNEFCKGIKRNDASLNFLIARLDFGLENIGVLKTSGWDLALNYGFELLGGNFHLRTLVTKTDDWEREVNGIIDSDFHEPGFQEWKGHNRLRFDYGPWSASWSARYIGNGVADNTFSAADFIEIGAVTYHDLNFRYTYETASDMSYEFYVGIDNAGDKQPIYIPSPSANSDTGTATAAGVYDIAGRAYYAGIELTF